MVNRTVIATVAAVSLATGCFILPPSEATYGAAATSLGAGYRASVGAHSASLDSDDDVDVDLGAGWVREGGRRRDAADGTYIALSHRLPWGSRRYWVGGRAEVFWGVDEPLQPRRGLVLHSAYRYRMTGGSASDRNGFVHGAFAIGFYADVGARQLAGGGAEVYAAFGVSMDLPAFGGAASSKSSGLMFIP